MNLRYQSKIFNFKNYFHIFNKNKNMKFVKKYFDIFSFKQFFLFFINLNFIFYKNFFFKSSFFLHFFNFFKSTFLNNYLNFSNIYYLIYYFINNIFVNNQILFKHIFFYNNKNLLNFSKIYFQKSFYFNFTRFKTNKNVKFHFFKNDKSIFLIKKIDFKSFNVFKLILKKKKKIKSIYINYLSKFFFKNIFFNDKLFNVFILNKYDWIHSTMARLTRNSFRLNFNEFFNLKTLNIDSNKITSFFNFYNVINYLPENNYFIFPQNNDLFNTNHLIDIKNKYNFFYKKIVYSYKLKTSNTLNLFNYFNIFNKFEFLLNFFFKPFFFKYFFLKITIFNRNNIKKKKISNLLNFFEDYFFYSKKNIFSVNNIIPTTNFNYIIKKKMLKVFNYSKFPTITVLWHYSSLIKFLEFCSGKKVFLRFFNFIVNKLNFTEKAQCLIWAQKVKYFRKVLGPRLFLNESLQIIYLSLKLKDPYILSNWIVSTMRKISFWKYKMFLRYIKYVLRYFFWVIYKELNIKGVKFQLKGKISVAGNARTRTVFHNVGFTSHTTFNNKILYHLNLVRSFTGVMGLKLWIVF